jgi:hypothetical protein
MYTVELLLRVSTTTDMYPLTYCLLLHTLPIHHHICPPKEPIKKQFVTQQHVPLGLALSLFFPWLPPTLLHISLYVFLSLFYLFFYLFFFCLMRRRNCFHLYWKLGRRDVRGGRRAVISLLEIRLPLRFGKLISCARACRRCRGRPWDVRWYYTRTQSL